MTEKEVHLSKNQGEQKPQPDITVEVVSSPLWGLSTKIVVIVSALVLLGFMVWRFQGLIVMTILAAVIAYILNPLVVFVNERTNISRGWVILAIYLVLAVALSTLFVSLGVAAYDQATDFINLVPNLIDQIISLFETINMQSEPIVIVDRILIEPINLPWESITNQLLGLIQPTLTTSGGFVGQLASTTVRTIGNFIFIFVISVYLIFEAPNIGRYLQELAAQPGYQTDMERMAKEFSRIWSAYLRGQVVLGVIIFFVVWMGLSVLGVRNALTLGLIAGLLEFVPTIGPIISTVIAMTVAFFQPSNPWDLMGWQFALVVLIFMILVQQVENNALVPRIVGNALDLHPLIVIIGVFMGASVAGILGAILAAPLLASLKLVAVYAWRKLFDQPPFPEYDPILQPETADLEEIEELSADSPQPSGPIS
ncbi:MAG: AI-2E family transporter [Candidatus Promineifilaceae bacterium]|jgi:predicted PurR-regulated permease PerM